MEIIFLFIVNGEIDTVTEGIANSISAENYLISRHNDVEIVSITLNRMVWLAVILST